MLGESTGRWQMVLATGLDLLYTSSAVFAALASVHVRVVRPHRWNGLEGTVEQINGLLCVSGSDKHKASDGSWTTCQPPSFLITALFWCFLNLQPDWPHRTTKTQVEPEWRLVFLPVDDLLDVCCIHVQLNRTKQVIVLVFHSGNDLNLLMQNDSFKIGVFNKAWPTWITCDWVKLDLNYGYWM